MALECFLGRVPHLTLLDASGFARVETFRAPLRAVWGAISHGRDACVIHDWSGYPPKASGRSARVAELRCGGLFLGRCRTPPAPSVRGVRSPTTRCSTFAVGAGARRAALAEPGLRGTLCLTCLRDRVVRRAKHRRAHLLHRGPLSACVRPPASARAVRVNERDTPVCRLASRLPRFECEVEHGGRCAVDASLPCGS